MGVVCGKQCYAGKEGAIFINLAGKQSDLDSNITKVGEVTAKKKVLGLQKKSKSANLRLETWLRQGREPHEGGVLDKKDARIASRGRVCDNYHRCRCCKL